MGGDGGVIASNRRYMRGAGTADCTADLPQQRRPDGSNHDVALELMTTCALTKAPLEFGTQAIVACPYGFLYHKEAAVQALLRRRESAKRQQQLTSADEQQQQPPQREDELGQHIRGLKDLYPVRFHLIQKQTSAAATQNDNSKHNSLVPACPVTGAELNGTIRALLLVPAKSNRNNDDDNKVNVISERALKEMGMESLQTEYGPFDPNNMIHLAPLPSMMETLQEDLQRRRREEEESKKTSKRKSKKRTNDDNNKDVREPVKLLKKTVEYSKTDTKTEQAAQMARDRAVSAVQKSEVLSSLFTKAGSSQPSAATTMRR